MGGNTARKFFIYCMKLKISYHNSEKHLNSFQCFSFFLFKKITIKMKRSLTGLGFQEQDIRVLKPAEAAKIIELSMEKGKWEMENSENTKEK